ncbi:MAG: amidase [Kamptonema sp. SIO1D9]|nr:amidase [Kamptonema sp. SIO1D9]
MHSSTSEQSIKTYLENSNLEGNGSLTLPDFLKLPLRQRYERLQQRPQLANVWAEQYAQWLPSADSKYRCITSSVADEMSWFRLGVKDTIDVHGMPTRLGLRSYRHYPRSSASALEGIHPHIKVQFKVATTELNIGFGAGCGNPLYPSIDPSGSSTGSAVSVAAHICDVGLGSDVLGSVRWPASHCGMVGLRMTHKPENLGGVFPLSPAMDALGWITRTADDLHFLLPMLGLERILGQQHSVKPHYRVGVLEHVYETAITSPEMLDMMAKVRYALGELGMSEVDVSMPKLWACRGDAWQLCARDAWLASNVWQKVFNTELHWSTRSALEVGSNVSEAEYQQINHALLTIRKDIDAWFDETGVDVVILPTDPNRPFDLRHPQPGDSTIPSPSDQQYDQKVGFTPLASFSGLPAITQPITLSADGKAPLSLQIVGRRDSERQLIDIAQRLESLLGPLESRLYNNK